MGPAANAGEGMHHALEMFSTETSTDDVRRIAAIYLDTTFGGHIGFSRQKPPFPKARLCKFDTELSAQAGATNSDLNFFRTRQGFGSGG